MRLIKSKNVGQAQNNGHIFISYRRDDSAGYTRAIYDQLAEHFTEGRIFMDVDAIEPGLPFDEAIKQAVGHCEILLAMIGKHWMEGKPGAESRINDENDFVRLEIATALSRNVRVIPVLLDGASMPSQEALPEPLRALALRNAIEISNTRFKSDVERLIEVVSKVLGEPICLTSPEQPRSHKTMRYWLLGGFCAVALLSSLAYFYYEKTQWLTGDQYQQAFDKQVKDGFYPDKVEAKCENEAELFRVEWKVRPIAAAFFSHHGITKDMYESKNQEYVSQGYSLESLNKFKDCSGKNRFQATWFKRN